MVGGIREPSLRRIVGAKHLGQALDRCLARRTLPLTVEILQKNPPHMILRLAFDGEAIVALCPRGDEVAAAGHALQQERREGAVRRLVP